MNTVTIGIYTEDQAYGLALRDGIARNFRRTTVNLMDRDEMSDGQGTYEQSISKVDIVVCDEFRPSREYIESRPFLCFVQMVGRKGDVQEDIGKIYRYDNLKKITSAILYYYSKVTDQVVTDMGGDGRVCIGVVSAEGGVGATSISVGIGRELRRFRGKTCFLYSLSGIPDIEDYFRSMDGKKGLEQLLYHLRKDRRNLGLAIDDFIVQDEYGIDSFVYGKGRNPLLALDVGEYRKLINFMVQLGRYQYFIFDLGNNVDDISIETMKFLDKIIFIKSEEQAGVRHMDYLERNVLHCWKGERLQLINRARDSREEEVEESDKGFGGADSLTVPYEASSFYRVENGKNICFDNELGISIRDGLEKLT